MKYGSIYTVTFRGRTQDLRFCGTDGNLAMFEDANLWNMARKPFGLTIDEIEEINATV